MYELMIKSNLLKILIASNLYKKLSTIMLKVKKKLTSIIAIALVYQMIN